MALVPLAALLVILASSHAQPPSVPVRPPDATPASLAERLQALEERDRRAQAELEALRKEVAQLQRSIEADKTSKSAGPVRPVPAISVDGAPSKGSADAPLVLIEYSDFECPFCRTFFRDKNHHKRVATVLPPPSMKTPPVSQ